MLGGEGPAPSTCTPAIMHAIVQQHLDCAAIFTILPLQVSAPACGASQAKREGRGEGPRLQQGGGRARSPRAVHPRLPIVACCGRLVGAMHCKALLLRAPTGSSSAHSPRRRLLQDIFALSPAYNTRPASEETINDPTNPEHYW